MSEKTKNLVQIRVVCKPNLIPFQVYFSIFDVQLAVLLFTELGYPGLGGRIGTSKRIFMLL